MKILENLFYSSMFSWLFSSLPNMCIAMGVCIFLFLVVYTFYKLGQVDSLEDFRKIKNKEEIKENKKENTDLENAILSLLDTSDASDQSKIKLNELTGKSLPISLKFKRFLNNMVHNPYNTVSVPKLLIISCLGAGMGICIGLLLKNVAAMVSLSVLGFSIPLNLVSLQCLKRQLAVMEGNLGLITTHLGVYRESPQLTDSLRLLLTVLTPGTREYKAIASAYQSSSELNMDIKTVLDNLCEELLTDKETKSYFDVCYIADQVSSDYKDALDYIPERLQPLVSKNVGFVNACFYVYICYIGVSLGCIVMMLYYRFFDEEIYAFLVESTGGQIGCIVLMAMLLAIGFLITKIATVVRIDDNKAENR